jgi:carboxyl-terminal processing protease
MLRVAVVVFLIALLPAHARAEARIALLIGNQGYATEVGPLKNPYRDVAIVGAALAKVGFEILAPVRDANRDQILFAAHDFADRLHAAGPDAVGFFYYSGHGVAVGGDNFLIPVNVRSTTRRDLDVSGVKLAEIITILNESAPQAVHFIVFDACRNNLGGVRGAKGFVPVAEKPGMLIAFSTAPGATASDTGMDSGPYAAALAAELLEPGLSHSDMFFEVRTRVAASTAQEQIPWTQDGLMRRVQFGGDGGRSPEPKPTQARKGEAAEAWDRTKDITNIAALELFIANYKDTYYAGLARMRIEELKRTELGGSSGPPTKAERPVASIAPMPPDAAKGHSRCDPSKNLAALDVFGDVLEKTRQHYVDQPGDKLLISGAIAGMLKRFPSATVAQISEQALATMPSEPVADTGNKLGNRLIALVHDVDEKLCAEAPPLSEVALVEAAIDGMLSTLDPHSAYLTPNKFKDMQVQARGEFGGLGIEVTMENGLVKVVSPLDDTPASRAGLQANDVITHLDGAPIAGQTLEQAIEKMRGPVHTPITLTVIRKGREAPFDVKIVRDVIKVNAVKARQEGDIIYVKISTFNEQTHANLVKAVEGLKRSIGKKLKGYVIDLRNNPGGLLDQAIAVSDDFLDKGAIVFTKGRNVAETQHANARPGDIADGKPIVVLINGGSASASEIVAGALQDHKRAKIIGTRSFGKGSVQTIIPLGGNNGALRLTTARYYTPSGRSIQARGIDPDVVVEQELPPELQSSPTPVPSEAALRGHLKGEAKDGKEGSGSSNYVPQEADKDTQLQYALKLLRGELLPPTK